MPAFLQDLADPELPAIDGASAEIDAGSKKQFRSW
jgi:hypothetical protein